MIAHRQKNGGISNLSEISKIKGIGPKSYKQAAGFLRIDSKTLKNGNLENVNPLDNTWVHPEVYDLGNWFQNFSQKFSSTIFQEVVISKISFKGNLDRCDRQFKPYIIIY